MELTIIFALSHGFLYVYDSIRLAAYKTVKRLLGGWKSKKLLIFGQPNRVTSVKHPLATCAGSSTRAPFPALFPSKLPTCWEGASSVGQPCSARVDVRHTLMNTRPP